MLRKVTAKGLFILGICSLFWIYQTCYVKEADVERYRALAKAQEKARENPQSPSLFSTTHQTRQGVSKEIWFTQEDNSRLETRIESAASVLTLHPKGRSFEVVEELHNIRCWMQDRLYTVDGKPMQQMRYLEADQGTYLYATQQFQAQTVALALFRLPGHLLALQQNPQDAFVQGVAKDVSFTVSGKEPQFQAKNFKANFSKL